MPGESPTKWQAQAYRFGVRRLESAVASGDPLLRGDARRRRLNISLIVSVTIAALILGVFAIIGVVHPDPTIGNAAVVIDKDTGGAYVNRNGTLYPAMNLASALLAAGTGLTRGGSTGTAGAAAAGASAPSRTSVGSDVIGKQPRGPLLGIPGAPNVMPQHLDPPRWTVCDTTTLSAGQPPNTPPVVRTTAIVGQPRPSAGGLGADAFLVRAPGAAETYLLFDGRRAVINTGDRAIQLAFGLGSKVTPRPISAALLNAVPSSAPIVTPNIPGHGQKPSYGDLGAGIAIGEVFGLQHANRSDQIYVALPSGVQQVTPLVGDLIRDEYSRAARLPLVEPAALTNAPRATDINLSVYPATQPTLLGFDSYPTVCIARTGTNSTEAALYRFQGLPLPPGAKPVSVTEPGSRGADSVYVRPGHGAVFASAQPTQGPGSGRPLYLVSDDGAAFPIVSQAALVDLGYTPSDVAETAPELIGLLPQGPTLDPEVAARFYPETGSYPQTGASGPSLPPATAGATVQG